jgi:hypothetical protein
LFITRNYCIVLFLLLSSFAFSQNPIENKNISLQLNKASLIDVIKAIETQSGVSFVYNTTVMKNAQKVCMDVDDVDLNMLLKTICKKSGNSYKIINNQVVFFKVAAQTNESIKILIKPKKQATSNTTKPISKDTSRTVKNFSSSKVVIDTTNINFIKDTIPPLPRQKNIELIRPIIPKRTKHISTIDISKPASNGYNNLNKENTTFKKAHKNKFFYSLQINNFLSLSSGFKSGDSLSSEKTHILNKSISSYGLRASINIGYTIKRFSFKSGLAYTHINEKLTEKTTYKKSTKQIDWRVITWEEHSSDGIAIYTDSVPITQTIITDSAATSVNNYTYRYIEIPFNIDYTFSLTPQWKLFSSIGITYAIALKSDYSSLSSVYKPEAVNKLDISAEMNVGLKFCANRLQYYFMAGGMTRSTWTPKSNLIKRNPLYSNFTVGIINYF